MDYVEEFGPISSTCGQTALVELRGKTHKRSINMSFYTFPLRNRQLRCFVHIKLSIFIIELFLGEVLSLARHDIFWRAGQMVKKKLLLLSHMERSEMPGKVRWR